MSLVMDHTKCPKGPPVGSEEIVLDAIGMLMMVIGVRDITEKNAPDVYARIRFYELLERPVLKIGEDPVYITPENVARWIGLQTNIRAVESSKAYAGRVGASILKDLERRYEEITK